MLQIRKPEYKIPFIICTFITFLILLVKSIINKEYYSIIDKIGSIFFVFSIFFFFLYNNMKYYMDQ